MRSRSVALGALLATMLLVAPAFAQRQGGQGFGGFGGGFGIGGGSSLAALVRIEEVQKEIELLDDQKTAIDKIIEDSRTAGQQGQGLDFQALRNLSEAERTARLAEIREAAEKRSKELDEKIKAELVAPQVERLEQLALQRQGVRALANADVQAKLAFTAEQKTKVQSIVDEQAQQARGAFGGGRGQGGNQGQRPQFNPEEFRAQQQKFESDMLAVLTDAQKTKFEEMKGKPFTFPQRGPGGPGGAGGQGRRPGADGQGGQGAQGGQNRQRQRPNPDA